MAEEVYCNDCGKRLSPDEQHVDLHSVVRCESCEYTDDNLSYDPDTDTHFIA